MCSCFSLWDYNFTSGRTKKEIRNQMKQWSFAICDAKHFLIFSALVFFIFKTQDRVLILACKVKTMCKSRYHVSMHYVGHFLWVLHDIMDMFNQQKLNPYPSHISYMYQLSRKSSKWLKHFRILKWNKILMLTKIIIFWKRNWMSNFQTLFVKNLNIPQKVTQLL